MVHDARVRSRPRLTDRSPLAQEAVSLHDPHPVISFHERLPRRLVAVPRARKLAADALTTAGEPGAGDDLALVITELVANAVRHGRGRRISMRLEADGRSVRVEVENRRWTTLPRRQLASDVRPGGRGLALVAACSREWGVVADGRGLTRVWAEVDR
ncbi:MAG TPA: ATP-binding protein [Miltoncostaeaceae bacterium]|jgi:signal transduction histidine kinase|nr:ATP-binding protein [Miltoncostaeaceae bacterium]